MTQAFLPGAAFTGTRPPVARLNRLCAQLAAVDIDPLIHLLADPFPYAGPWTPDRRQAVIDTVDPDLRGVAERCIDEVLTLPACRPGLVHGDLAGNNLLWLGQELTGVLDWDLAAAWDPALNVATLSSWFGRDLLAGLPADLTERALVWRRSFLLEMLAKALDDNRAERVETLVLKLRAHVERGEYG